MATVKVYPTSSNTSDTPAQFPTTVPSQTAADHYLNIDEVTADDLTSYCECTLLTHYRETCKMSDPGHTTETITNVRLYARVSGTGMTFKFILGGSAGSDIAVPSSFSTISADFSSNPNTGRDWTWGELYGASSLWFGVEMWGAGTKSAGKLSQFYIEITYKGKKINGMEASKVNGILVSKYNGL